MEMRRVVDGGSCLIKDGMDGKVLRYDVEVIVWIRIINEWYRICWKEVLNKRIYKGMLKKMG